MERRIASVVKTGIVRIGDVKTRRSAFAHDFQPAQISFGGVTLYAQDQERLDACLRLLQQHILSATNEHLILARAALKKLVSSKEGEDIESILFGAMLNRLICLGDIESIITLTINSRKFSVVVNSNNLEYFQKLIEQVSILLKQNGTLSPREIQNIYFPSRDWGTYATSQFILGHLVYMGLAVFIDQDIFSWPEEVKNAIG